MENNGTLLQELDGRELTVLLTDLCPTGQYLHEGKYVPKIVTYHSIDGRDDYERKYCDIHYRDGWQDRMEGSMPLLLQTV